MAKAKTPSASKPTNKQVITMPDAGSTLQVKKSSSSATVSPIDLESKIRQRAYELFVERGNSSGHENEDWLQAEREVLARENQQQTA
jgi:hypothetical protein